MDDNSKVQALSSLRKIPMVKEKKIHPDSLKMFNRLIIFAQRDMTVERSLQYELTTFPLHMFSNKEQKMNKANRADFSKTSLEALTYQLDLSNQPSCTLVIDGGWLSTWWSGNIRPGRRSPTVTWAIYVQCLGRRSQKIIYCGLWWLQKIAQKSRPHPAYQEFLLLSPYSTGYGQLDPKSEVLGQHS